MVILRRIFPFLEWFQDYDVETLRMDFMSGLTVALVLVPQSMAYAQLAGLPAYYGLYAAFLPPMVANLFGSSRQLATGPVAIVSLMTAAALEPLATAGSDQYIAYAVLLALMVGGFQLLLGILPLDLRGDPPVTHHQDSGGQVDEFRQLARDQQDRRSVPCQPIDQTVDLGLGADVHAPRWFIHEEDGAVGGHPPGNDQLLLIPSGEAGGAGFDAWRADLKSLDIAFRQGTLSPLLDPAEAAQPV